MQLNNYKTIDIKKQILLYLKAIISGVEKSNIHNTPLNNVLSQTETFK